MQPIATYIIGKMPMMTNIVGGYLTDLLTYIGNSLFPDVVSLSQAPSAKVSGSQTGARACSEPRGDLVSFPAVMGASRLSSVGV